MSNPLREAAINDSRVGILVLTVFGVWLIVLTVWILRKIAHYKPHTGMVLTPPEPKVDVPDTPPEYWVGVTRYEGADPEAAEAAFVALQGEADKVVGDVEWMNGASHVRKFKVV